MENILGIVLVGERERGGGGLAVVCFCWFSEGARGVGMVWKGAQGGVVLRGWVQWYEIRGAWGRTGKQFRRKYPFGLQKLEAKSFRFHQVEGIYTEKMITLSNVSQEGW